MRAIAAVRANSALRSTELKFVSCAEGVQVGRGDGRYVSWRRKP